MLGNFGAQGYDALSLSLFVWGMEISRTGGADHMQHTHTHTPKTWIVQCRVLSQNQC